MSRHSPIYLGNRSKFRNAIVTITVASKLVL